MARGFEARGRSGFSAGLLLAALAVPALGGDPKDAPKYPAGRSTQTFGDHTFDLLIPEGPPPERKFSLLLAMDADLETVGVAKRLVQDGFVVCAPRPKRPGAGGWATSEASQLLELADHLAAVLPVARSRVHVLKSEDNFGFATFVAFDKSSQAVSLCFLDTVGYRGKTPPASAKKHLAVLSLWSDPVAPYGDGSEVVERLAGKVRTVEHRHQSAASPYFRYWIHVADDRFQPGWDLSLDWLVDEPPAKGKPKAGEAPALPPALDRAKASAAERKRGALVYFWSAADAGKPEAKALQNDLFFRPDVRDVAGRLVPVKLERERSEKEFAALGLKTTPAVAVLDAAFAPVKTFEGPVEEKALLDAMRKVAAPKPRGK